MWVIRGILLLGVWGLIPLGLVSRGVVWGGFGSLGEYGTMMQRVTYERVQDDGVTLEIWACASTKKGARPLHLAVRRYMGPLGDYPGYVPGPGNPPVKEHELHRLARLRGTVVLREGVTESDAYSIAWDVGDKLRHGVNPVGEWAVWNLSAP